MEPCFSGNHAHASISDQFLDSYLDRNGDKSWEAWAATSWKARGFSSSKPSTVTISPFSDCPCCRSSKSCVNSVLTMHDSRETHPRAFVAGYPIKHSRSPLIHGFWLERLGLRGSYEKLAISPRIFPFHHRSQKGCFRLFGGNITIPHKEVACRWRIVSTPGRRTRRRQYPLVL